MFSLPFAVLVQQVVSEGPVTRADVAVAADVHGWTQDRAAAVALLTVVSVLGWPPWLALVAAASAGLVLVARRPPRMAAFLVLVPAIGGLLNSAVKVMVGRPRPELDGRLVDALGNSFPSGHSMSSTVTYGAVALVASPSLRPDRRRLLMVGTAVLVAAIGASRVALGVHYLSDVAAGFVLGAGWLAVAARISGVGPWRPAPAPAAASTDGGAGVPEGRDPTRRDVR